MKASRILLAPLCLLLIVGCQKSGSSDDDTGDDDSSNNDDTGKDDDPGDQQDDDDDEPDDVTCAGDPCSIIDQCGCGTDEACDLDPAKFAEGTGLCRTVTETGTDETLCEDNTDCATGYGCISGECRAYCDADSTDVADACGEGNRCDVDLYFVNGADDYQQIPGVKACTKTCRLDLTPVDSGCPNDPSIGCRLQSDDAGTYTDCTFVNDSGGGKQFAGCDEDVDCARGFGCFNHFDGGGFSDECLEFCVAKVAGKAVANTCAGGRTCYAVTGMTVGDIEYGACDAN